MFDSDLLHYLEGFLSEERKQRFLEVLANRTKFLTIAIEDVYQMHNTSAVIRSCDIFGLQEIHVVEARFGHDSKRGMDKNIAVGAEQWVDVFRYQNTNACIANLKAKGYQIIATTPHDSSHKLNDFKFSAKTALFFGTEKEGLSDEVLQKADGSLQIPMVGFSESLNVSVSAAIIMHELTTKLRNSTLPWQFSESEIFAKRLDWTKKSIKNIDGIMDRYYSK